MISLRPHQIPHAKAVLAALMSGRAALDASDTGTGKMYVACAIAAAFKVTPLERKAASTKG